MPRQTLTHKQKLQIRDAFNRRKQQGLSIQQNDIALWAKDGMRLSSTPSQAAISRILSTKRDISLENREIRRVRNPAQPKIEAALANWVRSGFDNRQCITGEVIKQQGLRIQESVNLLLPQNEHIQLKFTNGWLCNFQKRWGLKSRRVHGESGDVNMGIVDQELPKLQQLCSTYALDDIFNADETGLFYCMPPDRTISERPMEGRKKG